MIEDVAASVFRVIQLNQVQLFRMLNLTPVLVHFDIFAMSLVVAILLAHPIEADHNIVVDAGKITVCGIRKEPVVVGMAHVQGVRKGLAEVLLVQ